MEKRPAEALRDEIWRTVLGEAAASLLCLDPDAGRPAADAPVETDDAKADTELPAPPLPAFFPWPAPSPDYGPLCLEGELAGTHAGIPESETGCIRAAQATGSAAEGSAQIRWAQPLPDLPVEPSDEGLLLRTESLPGGRELASLNPVESGNPDIRRLTVAPGSGRLAHPVAEVLLIPPANDLQPAASEAGKAAGSPVPPANEAAPAAAPGQSETAAAAPPEHWAAKPPHAPQPDKRDPARNGGHGRRAPSSPEALPIGRQDRGLPSSTSLAGRSPQKAPEAASAASGQSAREEARSAPAGTESSAAVRVAGEPLQTVPVLGEVSAVRTPAHRDRREPGIDSPRPMPAAQPDRADTPLSAGFARPGGGLDLQVEGTRGERVRIRLADAPPGVSLRMSSSEIRIAELLRADWQQLEQALRDSGWQLERSEVQSARPGAALFAGNSERTGPVAAAAFRFGSDTARSSQEPPAATPDGGDAHGRRQSEPEQAREEWLDLSALRRLATRRES